ncbi:MAG: dephospho-CoA kinase [Candidatus Omnitrophica bacterium]|nr:dephospho-CoA kinase [Candidatus Omnitrophota bacterium]
MKVIGVTGTFCTGKTTVTAFFKKLGAHTIDADRIVHGLYKKRDTKRLIRKNFGSGVFKSGKIDRIKLGKIAFKNKRNLKRLCRIIHPKVIKIIKSEVKKSKKRITVVDVPLLIEAGLAKSFDYIIVVKCAVKKQVRRSAGRGFRERDVCRRRRQQMPLRKKIEYADFVIDNNHSKKYTCGEVMKIWKKISER